MSSLSPCWYVVPLVWLFVWSHYVQQYIVYILYTAPASNTPTRIIHVRICIYSVVDGCCCYNSNSYTHQYYILYTKYILDNFRHFRVLRIHTE